MLNCEMALDIQQSTPADLDGIAELLTDAFQVPRDAYFVNRRLLEWKYFEPGPDWQGARSYIVKRGGRIEAHCGVWPLNFVLPSGPVSGLCFVDWASGKGLPGAGVLLLKKLLSLVEVGVVAGGSEATRAIVPKLGFVHTVDIDLFARVLQPWKQYRSRPSEGALNGLARLGRNFAWAHGPSASIGRWSSRPISSFETAVEPKGFHAAVPVHSGRYLDFWLRIPAAVMSAFELLDNGVPKGYFVLARVGHQSRIADLRVAAADPADWVASYQAALAAARADREAYEVVAPATMPHIREALSTCGFRPRGTSPLFIHDRANRIGEATNVWWSYIDDDRVYIFDGAHPYAT